MAKSVERYFRAIHGHGMRRATLGGRVWRPAADVYKTGDGWIVKVDLAGVSANELEIIVDSSTLTISGCRRDTFFGEGVSYHQLEITYSRFERSLRFPCSIEGATVLRDYRDGLLILHLRSSDADDCEEE